MAEREQKKKQAPTKADEDVVEDVPTKSEAGEKIKGELDDLLDEIDEVLEVNSRGFCASHTCRKGASDHSPSPDLSVTPRLGSFRDVAGVRRSVVQRSLPHLR